METETAPTAPAEFDLNDNKQLQKIINQATHALGQRIVTLEQALEAMTAAHRETRNERDELFIQLKELRDHVEAATS